MMDGKHLLFFKKNEIEIENVLNLFFFEISGVKLSINGEMLVMFQFIIWIQ